ncbi:hypothetical protein [Actinoplanes regularis]|uniref:Peptidase inhibitor family I36 n=1 Tax=Actinoplanes regularis TaxID=52697 RepID=A0A239HCK2_9ACTN|nr:hypothetical protein [Actinoplanes regularis]GIE90996.1 hypothetical protein Are01nite_74760 [Actinoplanes regularis]GLW34305.1 hypothetical protein Areg01_72420 [Actinoplanes regularis]SNS79090.1 hypothetical protein SAMN06264365_12435 [Actinoplanes regularis]
MLKTLGRVAAALATAAAATALIPAGAAQASTCSTKYCGGVVTNKLKHGVYVTNCWPSTNLTAYTGSVIKCGDNGNKAATWNSGAYHSYFYLTTGDTTANYKYYYDTDGFRVEPGCTVTYNDGFGNYTVSARGYSTPVWFKLAGKTHATLNVEVC